MTIILYLYYTIFVLLISTFSNFLRNILTFSPQGSSSIINYPTQTSISINGTVSKVDYTGTYNTWLGLGKSGLIVLRFTNRATRDFKSWTFICDNGFHSDNLGYTLPSGTYDIKLLVNTVKQFQVLQLQFR